LGSAAAFMPAFLKAGTHAAIQPDIVRSASAIFSENELLNRSYALLQKWTDGLLEHQINKPGVKGLHGGLLCPACAIVHGRSADSIFPLLLMAEKTGKQQYLDATLNLYNWMENTVSTPDGAWLNEINLSTWKGITVFTAIALAESLMHFGKLLDGNTQARWTERLARASEYLYKTFTIQTGNINYPVAASYALALSGKLLGKKAYENRGREFAHQCMAYFTKKDVLLFGEGRPDPERSAKGCYSVDLGYNVEESLPSLVMYGKLMNDNEVLDIVTASLRAHMQFMLPDGAWDNSWGTRNFKWTYWGSRTSDGCQPAYALMADREPAFYEVALRNTILFEQCTAQNLLHGGPHYNAHGILPCIHHTFSHSKALATILSNPAAIERISVQSKAILPREKDYGVKTFVDIGTWLVSTGGWRATITGYDQEYTMKGGHASGGALSMLWHQKTGPLIAAGMNRYQMVESFNMQWKDGATDCLTPRFELVTDNIIYTNINDLRSTTTYKENPILFVSKAQLKNEDQQTAGKGSPDTEISYQFMNDVLIIKAACKSSAANLRYLLPIVSKNNEEIRKISDRKIEIRKEQAVVSVEADRPMKFRNERAFNFVPGLEAVILEWNEKDIEITISIK
jgi:hypothetical protein